MDRLMRTGTLASVSAALALAWSAPAEANMFGLFHGRHKTQGVAYYTAPCNSCQPVIAAAVPACPAPVVAACPAPIAVAQTTMQQRCYMAPVTSMVTQSRMEPVTSYQTSYYLQPITSLRTSTYFNPCTSCYENYTTPVTSYVQQAQVTPVTTMVERFYQTPVTTYEKRCVVEPVTTVQHYVPATAAVAVAPAVAAPVTAQYWSPVAPALVPAPQPAAQPAQQQPQGNVIERQYQTPDDDPNATILIEREIRNGQIKKETKYYIAPGEPVPDAKAPKTENGTTKGSSFVPKLKPPIPDGRSA